MLVRLFDIKISFTIFIIIPFLNSTIFIIVPFLDSIGQGQL